MKITDVKGISSEALKKESLPLYKAFIFTKDAMKMTVNVNIDLLGITPEAAVRQLLQDIPVELFTHKMEDMIDNMFGDVDGENPHNELDIQNFCESMQITSDDGNVKTVTMKNTVVSFAVFNMDIDDLKSKSLVDGDEDFFRDDIIAITLSDKKYTLEVTEKKLLSFKLSINPVNEERTISKIELSDMK